MVVYRNKKIDWYNEIENPEIDLGINVTMVDFPLSGMTQAQMIWQKCLPY